MNGLGNIGPFKCYVTHIRVGGVKIFSRKKRYEGVRFVSEIKVVYFWSKSDSVHSDLKHTYAEN